MADLFGPTPGRRMQMDESIKLTVESLTEYGRRYRVWCVAWSGGKDSTATLTLVVWLIRSGRVPAPDRLIVLYADTRQEILPLATVAAEVMDDLRELGIEFRVVTAPLDRRMWVYILGRGVPPPNNNTLRYCTRQIKIEPMAAVIQAVAADIGGKVLAITGVRQGESAVRDGRIALGLHQPDEYAQCRPWVERTPAGYRMWYCHRGNAYRLGRADSPDGLTWERRPTGLDVSPAGWDSEMIGYPALFTHRGRRFLLYNGNGYGRTGFGVAVEEADDA